jgi:hypothetical protein
VVRLEPLSPPNGSPPQPVTLGKLASNSQDRIVFRVSTMLEESPNLQLGRVIRPDQHERGQLLLFL